MPRTQEHGGAALRVEDECHPPAPSLRTQLHALNLFPDMDSLFGSLCEDARQARERLWVETYIYRHDAMGRRMGESLAAAAARGLDVRLLYDALGSWQTDKAFFAELSSRGVQVRSYRPLRVVLRDLSPWPRDHTRIVVSDAFAYTGGLAWGNEWMSPSRGGHGWHDAGLRVWGPCVEDFAHVFERRWAEAMGASPPADYATESRYPDLELVTDAPAHRTLVFDRHCERIRQARSRVWIENAYFVPPRDLNEALLAAAGRGVDVRLILPAETDVPIMARAARDEYQAWLEAGLKIYEYVPSILHAKTALIDDDWATVGTFNGNLTSLMFANEINLIVFDRRFVQQMEQRFQQDFRDSLRITPERLKAQPALSRVANALANETLRLLETVAEPSLQVACLSETAEPGAHTWNG